LFSPHTITKSFCLNVKLTPYIVLLLTQAIIIETQELEKVKAKALPSFIAPGGSRYQNMREGDNGEDAVKNGDEVTIKYKVLKLGKRSYDGLSGEGTVVFSRGK